MKKKLVLVLTALAIIFTTLFSFTACSKDKVNIKKGMKPEKVFEMLANAKITSFTTESKRGEEVTRQTITTDGYAVTRTGGENDGFHVEIFDGKRSYVITNDKDGEKVEIMDMMGANLIPYFEGIKGSYLYMFSFYPFSDYIYNERNGYENEFTVKTEKGKVVFTYKELDLQVSVYGFNETTLEIPDKYKDYATRPTTKKLANFEDAEGGLAFTGLNRWIDEFVIPEKVDGKDVVAIKLVESFYDCEKLTIPVSIKKIDGFSYFLGNVDEMYYAGTKEQWNAIELTGTEVYEDKTVHCSDGDVVITRN